MKILREITDWGPEYNIPGHIYHVLDNGKLAAFDNGSGLVTFSRPLMFDRARRKFETLQEVSEKVDADAITVQGSSGKIYTIQDGHCSCPGFKFRGHCKHIDQVKAA